MSISQGNMDGRGSLRVNVECVYKLQSADLSKVTQNTKAIAVNSYWILTACGRGATNQPILGNFKFDIERSNPDEQQKD